MKKYLKAAMLAAALGSGAHAALAAEVISESRSVDARAVKIELDGVISLKVKQGATASLTIYGEPEAIRKVVVEQSGDTLHIGTAKMNNIHFGNKRELRAELTLPNLRTLTSGGVGATEISGFNGDNLRLALDGAGSVKVDSQYRNIDARLGGVGGMTINGGKSDNVELQLNGAGRIEMIGQTRQLNASLGGVGSLDAEQLHADAIDVRMSGLGSAALYAKTSASLKLTGLGSAKVYGNPTNRNASARGMGSVSWQ
ncbi:GIN domain-containing protein [Duganella sp. P38]|uniref:GIN domain-containing protein n=1 Tax=Duganella sp. P38 TaxID=3423949 RepID=UPI003D7AEECA